MYTPRTHRDSYIILMIQWIIDRSARHGPLIIALCLAVTIAAGWGASRLRVAADHTAFFDPDSPLLHQTNELRKRFGTEQNVFFAIVPHRGTVFTTSTLSLLRDVARRCRSLPGVVHVETLADFPVVDIGLGGPDLRPLVSATPASLSSARLDTLRRIALDEPLLVNWLVSPDGRAAGVNVSVDPRAAGGATTRIARAAVRLADSVDHATTDHDIHVTGGVLIDAAFSEASTRDVKTLAPLMYLIVGLFLFVLVPSGWAVAGVLITVALATATAMGLFGWGGMALTPPTSVTPVIVLVVCVAGTIHVIVGLFHEMRRGSSKVEALRLSFTRNGTALLVTSITTAVGLLCLNFSDAPPFRDLGNSAAAGVIASFLYTITFLPAFLMIAPVKTIKTRWGGHDLMGLRLGTYVLGHSRVLLIGMLSLSLLLSLGASRVRFDDVFEDYFGEGFRFRRDLEKVAKHFAGIDYVICSVRAPGEGVADSTYLARLDTLSRACRDLPGVIHVSSLTEVLRKVHHDLFPDRTPSRALPKPSLARRVIGHANHNSDSRSAFVGRFVDSTAHSSRIILRLSKVSSSRLRAIERRLRERIDTLFPPQTEALIGGTSLVFAKLSARNATSMMWSIGLSLVLMTIALIVTSRSVKYGLLSLVPNVLPIAMGFGIWGLFVGQAGMGLTVVAPIALGVVVDDTVHFLLAYLRGRDAKSLPGCGSVRYAYRHVTDAAVFTTVVLTAGFCVLAFSSFQPTAQMGQVTAVTLVLALVVDLLLFPPLLQHTCRGITDDG